ncbi:MAG: anti-sigma factor antagonist [Muribaculaceae bacterium]|nr:anti-sigma factor antagonist [Roseburia sp.]MCM1432044.1 anti-sigma factor antagonist [Muribaculaceae bacterium]MCM1493916.1 anti-sigma factor antagonist [Muribaculaceae bacterium]
MDLEYQMNEETLVVPMPREVDHHAAKSMSREIDFLIDSWHVRELVFDFADTEFMDSSVIGVMIGRSRTMEMYGGEIYAVNLGERAKMIFVKSGLDKIIRTNYSGEGR